MPIKTRGDLLRLALTTALSDAVKIVRGLRTGLTHDEREAFADDAVSRIAALREDPCRLNEDLPPLHAAQPPVMENWMAKPEP